MPLRVIHRPIWHYLILLLIGLLIALLILNVLIQLVSQFIFLYSIERQVFLYLDLILYPLCALFLIYFLWNHFVHVTPTASQEIYRWNDGPWLHYKEDPCTSITINWVTQKKTETKIQFGSDPLSMNNIEGEFGKIHRITINNLKPDKQYFYEIIGLENDIQKDSEKGKIYSFKTAPDKFKPFKFVVIGDTQNGGGFGDDSWAYPKIVQAFMKKDFDLVIHTGDATDQGNDLKSWHMYFQASLPFSVSKPMHIVAGNHDTGTNCLTDKTQKKLPDEGANYDYLLGYKYEDPKKEKRITPFTDRYFSFDYSNCRFLFIDTQNSKMAEKNSTQLAWLEERLSSLPEDYWAIAILHRAPIELKKDTNGKYYLKYERFGSYVIPILLKYKVRLIISGHAHIFQIKTLEAKDPTYYIISGGAGNEFRKNDPIKSPEFTKLGIIHREDSSHYLLIDVKNNEIDIKPYYSDNSLVGGREYNLYRTS